MPRSPMCSELSASSTVPCRARIRGSISACPAEHRSRPLTAGALSWLSRYSLKRTVGGSTMAQASCRGQHANAETTASPGDGGNALARNNDPRQVERWGGRNGDALAIRIRRQLALDAQRLNRPREGELLAQKSMDESPAADFAA